MIKSVTKDPVHTLLSVDNHVVYHVPKYQREYSWGRAQWDQLFDDLLDAEGEHFLGTIICIDITTNATEKVVLELVDGQQRLTTISILLAALHSLLAESADPQDMDSQFAIQNLQRRLVLKASGEPRLRPQVQGSNMSDYHRVLHESGAGVDVKDPKWSGVRRVKKAYYFFRRRLESLSEDGSQTVIEACTDVKRRLEQSLLVKLEVDSHSNAFVLFESLNNRGMQLTPLDLIKNVLLAQADATGLGVDDAFEQWQELLADLGDDYGAQERFFRQFYNAFRTQLPTTVPNAQVATRSNLIRIYEHLIKADLQDTLDRVLAGGSDYRRIIGRLDEDDERTMLDRQFTRLSRAQGAPSYILLLRLMSRTDKPLSEPDLADVVSVLIAFFVRRNLTGTPQTYALAKLFIDLAEDTSELGPGAISDRLRAVLRGISATDEEFRGRLEGPIYAENVDIARFLLVAMAEADMTKESARDLWERHRSNNQYVWTIEHILPQGAPLPSVWVEMLGGGDMAHSAQEQVVHTLGNLTISGYNSNLGNKSFQEKKDRADSAGNFIGYRNGMSLNADVVDKTEWNEETINARTQKLVDRAVDLFPL